MPVPPYYSFLALGCPVSFARHCEACSEANDEATQKSHDIAGLLRRSLRYTPRNDVQKKQDNPKLKRYIYTIGLTVAGENGKIMGLWV